MVCLADGQWMPRVFSYWSVHLTHHSPRRFVCASFQPEPVPESHFIPRFLSFARKRKTLVTDHQAIGLHLLPVFLRKSQKCRFVHVTSLLLCWKTAPNKERLTNRLSFGIWIVSRIANSRSCEWWPIQISSPSKIAFFLTEKKYVLCGFVFVFSVLLGLRLG